MNFDKLTEKIKSFLQEAQTLATRRSHQSLEPEHLLKVMLDDSDALVAKLVRGCDGDLVKLKNSIDLAISKIPSVSGSGAGQLRLSGDLGKIVADAQTVSEKAGDRFVTTERILQAMIMAKKTDVSGYLEGAGISDSKLNQAINDILGPAINFELFSKGVLGKHRRNITPEQFTAFVAEFKRLLIGTYASTVFEYSGQKINYLPFSNPDNKDRVKVRTEFLTQSGGKIPMTFSMNKRGDTQWRVYNIKVQTPDATIELIPLFRNDYSDRISKVGIDKLIEEMRAINNS